MKAEAEPNQHGLGCFACHLVGLPCLCAGQILEKRVLLSTDERFDGFGSCQGIEDYC